MPDLTICPECGLGPYPHTDSAEYARHDALRRALRARNMEYVRFYATTLGPNEAVGAFGVWDA